MKKKRSIWAGLGILTASLCILSPLGCGKEGAAENARGLSLYEEGNYEEAAAAFGSAVGKDASSVEYRLNLAMAELSRGAYEEAMAEAAQAGELEPENPSVFRVMGLICLEQEDYSGAISYFESALEALGSGGDRELSRDVRLYKAEAELKSGDYESAAADYGELISRYDSTPEYYLLRGKARMAMGDTAGAGEDFAQTVELKPREASYYVDIYLAYAENGSSAEGASYLETALSLADGGDERAAVYYYMASAQMDAGGYSDALANIQSGLSEAEDAAVIQELAYSEAACYEYLGEYGTALEKFQAYRDTYGSDEALEHEIAFLTSRVQGEESGSATAEQQEGL